MTRRQNHLKWFSAVEVPRHSKALFTRKELAMGIGIGELAILLALATMLLGIQWARRDQA